MSARVENSFDTERRRLALRPELRRHARDELARFLGIAAQHVDHLIDRDVIMVGMPAIVIGHHGDHRVRQLRFAREFGLRHRGHADHGDSPRRDRGWIRRAWRIAGLPWRDRFRAWRTGCLPLRHAHQAPRRASGRRMRHRDMRHEARAEEALLARMGAVDELVDHHECARRQIFTKRTAGGDGDHVRNAGAFQRVDIGAVIDRGRRMDMPAAVARQEQHVDALKACRSASRPTARPRAFSPLPNGRLFQRRNS